VILHGTDIGAGPPVALLHGLFGRSQNLGLLARRLSSRFRVLSLDLRNHGASPHTPGMAYPAMAQDVLETLAACTALPVALLGHSMGGKVAMLAALTQPDAVSRLVVADIAPVAYRHHNAAISASLQALDLIPGMSRSQADSALAPQVTDPAVRGFLLQNLSLGQAPFWRIGLDEIAAGMADIEGFPDMPAGSCYHGPALFLRGGRSEYVQQEAMPAISRLFPTARLETIADAGHWLHADQPAAFAASVEKFFSEAATPAKISL